MLGFFVRSLVRKPPMQKRLKEHFRGLPLERVVTVARSFPLASRADLQSALEDYFASRPATALLGIHSPFSHETPTLAHLCTVGPMPVEIGPLQHDDIDVGDPLPVRCLKNGLWLSVESGLPFAVLLTPEIQYGCGAGVHLDLGVPEGEAGLKFSQDFFAGLESRVNQARTYRGRVISL